MYVHPVWLIAARLTPVHLVIRRYIPSNDLRLIDHDEESGDRLTVPCPLFRVPETIVGRPSDMYQYVASVFADFP